MLASSSVADMLKEGTVPGVDAAGSGRASEIVPLPSTSDPPKI